MTTYLLDANVFMAASRLHYGLDFCPAFWEWLIDNNKKDRVFSIERIADEVQAGNDALAHKWVVVTHEVFANSTKRIKIPNACMGVGIQHMSPFEMLRREKARFILGRQR